MILIRSLFARCLNSIRILVSTFLHWVDSMLQSFMSLKSSYFALAEDVSDVSVAESDVPDVSLLECSRGALSDVNQIRLLYCQNVLILAIFDCRVILLLHLFQNHYATVVV